MKILHIINDMEVGGAQRLVSQLLPRFAANAEVELLVCAKPDNALTQELEQAGIKIHTLDCSPRSPRVVSRLVGHLKRCDVAHVHLFPMLYWTAAASCMAGTPLVYTEHSTSNRRRGKALWLPLERWAYGRYKKVISISAQTQQALTEWIGRHDHRFVTIENGVDLSRFTAPDISARKPQVIMIGRFVESKDHPTLIRAMRHVAEPLRLVLAGDGPLMEACRTLAHENGVAERIDFLGTRHDVPQLIAESMIGVHSANWEGFGLTAVEMMAGGLPVVASDVEGLKQVVEGAGELFPKGDEAALAEAINKLYEDHTLYAAKREASLTRATSYSIERMAEEYMNIYRELCCKES